MPDERLTALLRDPKKAGIFVDFDGTLSNIVDDPAAATLVAGAEAVLASLVERFAIVAVVSGRSLEDLRARIKVRGVLLAGAYGRERSDRDIRRRTEGWETVAVAATAALSGASGVLIERKGAGVALHYRNAPDQADAVRDVATTLATEFELDIKPGRMVYELVVPGPGKGEAMAKIAGERGLRAALAAGDDVADLEAFVHIKQVVADTAIVAVRSNEAPDGLEAVADLVVDGPEQLVVLLGELV